MIEGSNNSQTILLCLAFPDNPYQDSFELGDYARNAYEKACQVAAKLKARIEILAIIEDYHYAYDDIQSEFEHKRLERTQEAVQHLVNNIKKDGIEVDSTIDSGVAWYEIIKYSVRKDVDWIMLSSSQSGIHMDGSVLGSTARKVVRKAEKPVWVVHDTPVRDIEHIVMPIDLSPISTKIVRAGLRLAKFFDAKPRVVHSVDYSGELAFFRYADADDRREEYRKQVEDNARESLRELVGEAVDETELLISPYSIVRVLPEMVENGKADMIVMGSLSRTGIAGMIVGNSAEKLLDRLTCPLLILKPDGWESPLSFDDKE